MDVINQHTGERWYYSDIVKDHFFHPQNLLLDRPKNEDEFDAHGMVGSPACGDMMEMWMKVCPVGQAAADKAIMARQEHEVRIVDLKWKTFGCASAIAATSMFSVMLTENRGMTLAEALRVRPQDVMMRLGGLPNRKIHCSVLADKAFQKTANDYFRKNGLYDKIIVDGARVIDPRLNITDKDIEEAVLEGAQTLEEVQKKLKVGIGSPELTTEIEQLIRFYKEKYYG
ncbi:MAG TPA: iron-sulfur cluster assembly scaffold protein [Candidatus Paceibacterota bacterium]